MRSCPSRPPSDPETTLQRLTALLEASPAVSYVLEPEGRRATFRSANAATHFGWPTDGSLHPDDCWRQSVHPDDLPAVERRLEAWLAAGAEGVLRRAYRIRHGDGRELHVDDHLRAVRDPSGSIVELVGLMEDAGDGLASSRRLDRLLRNVPGTVFQLQARPDGSSRYLYASAGMRDIFGIDPETVREDASPVFERIHADDVEAVRAAIGQALVTLEAPRAHYRVNHPERGLIWARGRSTPERLPDGSVLLTGYITDATDEEEAKRELERTRDELQGFFDVALDLLCIASLDGRFLRVNKAWEEVLGRTVIELEGQCFLDFVHPDDLDATLAEVERLSGGGDVLGFTNRYRAADGSYRRIEWRSRVAGERVYAAARDVTAREAAFEALQESRRQVASLYELAPLGILLSRFSDGRCLQANPELARMTGVAPDVLLDLRFHDLFPKPSQESDAAAVMLRLHETGRYGPIEWRLTCADGGERPVTLQGVLIEDRCGEAQIWSIVEDIGDRKR
ncbi:MAG: PAS domain-containing protein, partial [Pseudomonadota bacterium]